MHGEIDVMEGLHQGTSGNLMSLHTTDACHMKATRHMTGEASANVDCFNGTEYNAGCGVTGSGATYGPGFNQGGGGVMAVEWRDEGIRMWQWPRAAVPADVAMAGAGGGNPPSNGTSSGGGGPDPSSWGTALADFPNTECNMGQHFRNASIIANIDLCGDLGGQTFKDAGCESSDPHHP